MAKLFYYHDRRSGTETFPLKIRIYHNKGTAYLGLGISVAPEQWDLENGMVIGHPSSKAYNARISSEMGKAEKIITRLEIAGDINKYSAAQLKEIIANGGDIPDDKSAPGDFYKFYIGCIPLKKKESTRSSYEQALRKLQEYDSKIESRTFEEINLRYIEEFDAWMAEKGITQNSRNVYFRNIRAVFNRALDEDITTNYPFRKFKLKKQATKKRSLTIDELRTLRDYPCEEWQKKHVDMFFLMFYLIGINGADLFAAKHSQVEKGRLNYERAKTYKDYTIKIEPEAQAILDKYKGEELLLSFCEKGKQTPQYFLQRMSKVLKTIGPWERKGRGGKKTHTPLFPKLSQYWCRHTWATLAAEIDIPKDTIAMALGHEMGNTTTAIYINYNIKKVDEANRRVIDYLNEK